jgi:hypothetical protein
MHISSTSSVMVWVLFILYRCRCLELLWNTYFWRFSLLCFISIPLIPYSYGVEVFHFSLDLYTIRRTPWTSDRPVTRPLPKYRTTQTHNKRAHTPNIHSISGIRTHDHSVRASEDSSCLRSLGYRDRLASERAKTVHALDRSATVTG